MLSWLVDNIAFLLANESHTFGLQDNDNKGTKPHFSVNFALLIPWSSYISQVPSAPLESEQLQQTHQWGGWA